MNNVSTKSIENKASTAKFIISERLAVGYPRIAAAMHGQAFAKDVQQLMTWKNLFSPAPSAA